MEMKITTLEGKEAGSVKLPDAIFGLEPRTDIIQRCVNWQLAKRQRGTHKTKGRAEIWRTGKKMYAQKGTGGARHGSARVPQFRGGGRAFGPLVRSHAIDLPKKVRALALKHEDNRRAETRGDAGAGGESFAGSEGRKNREEDEDRQTEGRCEAEVARQDEVEGIRGSRCRSVRSRALLSATSRTRPLSCVSIGVSRTRR